MGVGVESIVATSEPQARSARRRIVLTTFGSLGDLYPYLAVAQGLKSRGHEAIIATTPLYQERIEARGIGFRAVRPEGPDITADQEIVRRIMHQRKGPEILIREIMMPALRDSYEDLLAATQGADLLVSHVLTYSARLIADRTGIPWVSTYLQPLGFFSCFDPPVLPPAPFLARLRFLGPRFHRALFGLAKWSCRSWAEPWRRLRTEIGLAPISENPLFEGLYSPTRVLCMFSQWFAAKQPDWPSKSVLTGFAFPDPHAGVGMPAEVSRFLEAGPPPLVFTLGSSGIFDTGPFYEHAIASAQRLGERAILVVGDPLARRPDSVPEGILVCDYVPFAELFPHASVVVHAGGVGTMALAMRAGRPQLLMPCAHDQFDNAARATRLGIARTISRRRYRPRAIAAELQRLRDDSGYVARAASLGEKISSEDGVRTACDALEELLPARC
jgi:UDP:flavonoid glycosyltransferase YjiC (YdhE family)